MPFEEHPRFPLQLPNSTRIWRYMDFPKFVSLLEYGSSFFCRVDKLGDAFEGSYPKAKIQANFLDLKSKNGKIESKRYRGELDESLEKSQRDMGKKQSQCAFVNCWHINQNESSSLWGLYGKDKGIAIQSTLGRLKSSFQNDKHRIYLFPITYKDYSVDVIDDISFSFSAIIHKRIQFDSEREIRALIFFLPTNENIQKYTNVDGINVNTSLDTLIENIYLNDSTGWLTDLLNRIVKRYNLSRNINKSSLTELPE